MLAKCYCMVLHELKSTNLFLILIGFVALSSSLGIW